jgi:thiamine biosynthesis lipoprotein
VIVRDRHSFRAMGCDVVVAGAGARRLAAIERLFRRREECFSRFLPASELNRVNAGAGSPVRTSPEFADMLALALAAVRETGGLVDPTLGAALEAAGYDGDFESLADDGRPAPLGAARDPRGVRLLGHVVLAPRSVRLDLNGVVKGRTVDDAVALLDGDGFVSAGGDLATRGTLVAALPRGGTVELRRGALATSGTDRRHWTRGGRRQHHLIDPRTGASADSPWEQVTVCALTCVGADIAAKAAFLLGPDGPAWLDERGLPGRFVTPEGDIHTNESWRRSLEREPACT